MKNKVFSNSIIYTVCGLLLKCFAFFLLPLYTAFLTTEDYGITSISNTFITTMSFVVAFSLYAAVLRFYVDLKENPEKLKRFYGTMVSTIFLSSIFFAIVFFVAKDLLSKYVFSGLDFYPVILISIISLVFNCQYLIYENILRSQQKAMKYALVTILFFFFTLILNILFVVVFRMGAIGVLSATMLSNIIYTIFFMVDLIASKSISFCLDWDLLKKSLKYSLPLMPHNLSTHIAMLVSKVLIGGTSSFSTLGLYSVAAQFANVSDTVQAYINNAYSPWLYEKLHDKSGDYKKSLQKTINSLVDAVGLFFLGIALFSQDYILLFLDKSYAQAWKFVPLIVLVFAVKIPYYYYAEVLLYYKEASKKLFIATLSGSFLNLLLSYFLIPKIGVYGSILADTIAMIWRVIIIVVISLRVEDVGMRLTTFIGKILQIAAFIFGGLLLSYAKYDSTFSVLNLLYKIAFVAFYLLLMLLRNKNEVLAFKESLLSKLKKK